ncbi:MAG: hypothetical protein [Thorarchaeia virus VerdaV2]|uniref:Uncharacterized protein n=1 Tax=Thorarchaeia virus VerdaV2 TaxID=3070171 RepID=A0AA35CPK1_9CAUD|nr:MAG: hypothetical protein QIT42_gp04 [Thorarchaeia virus VerdaV2]BDI54898.1 MAG: hypothetical protein [Thorarchaeia virus VerdaV2]
MSDDKIEPDKTEPEPEPGTERDETGKFKKKEPATPEEKKDKTEPTPPEEPPKEPSDEDNKKQIEALNKELVELRTFKANRMKEVDDYEARLKAQAQAQKTKEDQKLKGFKKEKQSEGDQTEITPLYKKMSFKDLTETSKKMRKK